MSRRALLEGALGEPTIVESSELHSPSTQRPDEREQYGNSVEEETEPPYELQSVLGLTLDLIEWMAQGKKNGIESAAAMCSKRRIAVLFRHLEGTTRRIDSLPERSCPRDHDREEEIGPSPKLIQSATFEQIAGHLSESITFVVVAEVAAGDQAHRRVCRRCGVAVAALQAEIGGPADAERAQIRVDVQGWYTQAGE